MLEDMSLDFTSFPAVADERMRVGCTVEDKALPLGLSDGDAHAVDVRVRRGEMCANGSRKKLGRVDGVLLRKDVDGVFDGVSGDYHGVVGAGVSRVRI